MDNKHERKEVWYNGERVEISTLILDHAWARVLKAMQHGPWPCDSRSLGYHCCLEPEHNGKHVAAGPDGEIYAYWDDEHAGMILTIKVP